MIVLVDADSLVYSCSWGAETEEDAYGKFDQVVMHMINEIEQTYDVSSVVFFHGSTNNFRYQINKTYKANRKSEKPPFFTALSRYVKTFHEAVSADGEEVDDLVARRWKEYAQDGHEVCIMTIDKDYYQLPALIFNYSNRKRGFYKVSQAEAIHNFWTQMITGDAADNVNYLPGKGKVFAKKHLEGARSEFSYLRRVYILFLEKYGESARQAFCECYKLLKLDHEETSKHFQG